MKKVAKRIGIALAILLVIYGIGAFVFTNTIIPNTKLYNQKVSSYSAAELQKILEDENISLSVKDKRKTINIPLKTLNYSIENTKTIKEDIIKKQNQFMWPISIIAGQNFELLELKVNEKELHNWIVANNIVANKGLTESKDAYFEVNEEDGKVTVVDEIVGEQLDDILVEEIIFKSLSKGTLKINLKKAIIKPNITASSLNDTIEEVEYKVANKIEIEVAGKDYTIIPTNNDKLKWLTIDYQNNEIIVDKKAIKNYLSNINQEFIKKGGAIETVYRAANGKSTLIEKGNAVSGVDEYAVTAKIYDSMKNNYQLVETVKAVSISKPKVTYEGHKSIDNNFIEVSIAKQKVYLYSNGKLVLSADVITGLPNGDRDTQPGKYTIMFKATNFTMRGAQYGYDYEAKVNYWMPFEGGGGIGLHDAPWHAYSQFGGNTYLSNGSHGCINMRLADARTIFNTVTTGTAVWVH
ncbi:L,D-transpeptidase [Erysipelotrichaceae bacterium OttesenSCG-928-M19]|nr:L,D-transpeptidase [Erysipelotrichaceae bacterium OttesenSCG-928-M19]